MLVIKYWSTLLSRSTWENILKLYFNLCRKGLKWAAASPLKNLRCKEHFITMCMAITTFLASFKTTTNAFYCPHHHQGGQFMTWCVVLHLNIVSDKKCVSINAILVVVAYLFITHAYKWANANLRKMMSKAFMYICPLILQLCGCSWDSPAITIICSGEVSVQSKREKKLNLHPQQW